MNAKEIDAALRATLADGNLSRGERQALTKVLENLAGNRAALLDVRTRAFAAAREALSDAKAGPVLDWLAEVVRVIDARQAAPSAGSFVEALFSPGETCVRRLAALIDGARQSIDVCVYTITDDRISGPLARAARRGVEVRIVTDDEKAEDVGSDIAALGKAGIAVAGDDSEAQMHHKFAVFDGKTLATGSYNWTRSAAAHNRENIVVTDDPRLVHAFRAEFERLWEEFR